MPSPSQSLPHHQLSSHQSSTGAKKSPSHEIRLPQASRQFRSSAIAGPEKAANAVTTMASAARTNWMRLIKQTSFCFAGKQRAEWTTQLVDGLPKRPYHRLVSG